MKSRLLHGALLQLGGSKDVVDRLTSALSSGAEQRWGEILWKIQWNKKHMLF